MLEFQTSSKRLPRRAEIYVTHIIRVQSFSRPRAHPPSRRLCYQLSAMNNAFTVALRTPARANFISHSPLCRFTAERFFRTLIQAESRISPLWIAKSSISPIQLQIPRCRQFAQFSHPKARTRPPFSPSKPSSSSTSQQFKDLTKADFKQIFGTNTTPQKANFILVKLQRRRVSGSLIDEGLEFPEESHVSQEEAERALSWLREKFPMDEEAAAGRWAQEELERLKEQERDVYRKKGQKLGFFKKEDRAEDSATIAQEDSVDAGSVLVQRQKEIKRERQLEEEKRKEDEAEAARTGKPLQLSTERQRTPWGAQQLAKIGKYPICHVRRRSHSLSQSEELRERRRRYADHKATEAELEPDKIFAQRSTFSRLFPSTVFTALFIYACYVFASHYEPPPHAARILKDLPPAMATFFAIFNLNAIVFILWRAPSAWHFLNRYFMVSAGHPRVLSLLGAMFSHQQFLSHFLPNMAILFLVGNPVHDMIGRGNYLAVYLGTGVLASLGGLWRHVLTKNFTAATVGSSGALFGLIGCYFGLKERDRVSVPGLPEYKFEYNSAFVFGVILVFEVMAMLFVKRTMTDHGTHITGLVTGYLAGKVLRAQATNEGDGDGGARVVEQTALDGVD